MVFLKQFLKALATQKEAASLAESVEFESEEEYREKLETLKESYFSELPFPSPTQQTLSEGVDKAPLIPLVVRWTLI